MVTHCRHQKQVVMKFKMKWTDRRGQEHMICQREAEEYLFELLTQVAVECETSRYRLAQVMVVPDTL